MPKTLILDVNEFGEIIRYRYVIQKDKERKKIEIGKKLDYPHFEDVVFNERMKEFMKLVLEKLKSGEKIDLLFVGNAGTGKTFSAKMICCELGWNWVYINGEMGRKKIIEILKNVKDNSVICIDEIHNLTDSVAEVIYPAIEYRYIGEGGEETELKNIIFIGTTTEPEELPKPLLDRFFRVEFEEPDKEILSEILRKQGVENQVIDYLLNYTQNIRQIKKLLEIMRLYGGYNMDALVKVFRIKGINLYSGLSKIQEEYIEYLKKVGKASLRNICLVLRKNENFIKYEVEPELIRKGIIVITSRGRELSPDFAWDNYENLKKEEERNHSKYSKAERDLAIEYLNQNPEIKKKFANRYFELVDFIAEQIKSGVLPDEIDFMSFGNDKDIEESYKDNYLEDL